MKTICVMQPYVFPYLPYYQLAVEADEFWVLDDVQFIRRGWMNRNRILLAGQKHSLTFPVRAGSRQDLVYEKLVAANFDRELGRILATIRHAYSGAPYARELFDMLNSLVQRKWSRFIDFAKQTLEASFNCLEIQTPLYLSSSLKLQEDCTGEDRIISICEIVDAKRYVNPIGGAMLYNSKNFIERGVELCFLEGNHAPYSQGGDREFEPGLSILDLIANLNPSHYRTALQDYTIYGSGGEQSAL